MLFDDTIAAPATAPGRSGVAVIRISGPGSREALRRIFSYNGEYQPRRMYYGRVAGDADDGMAVFFPGPASYTGEDCAELHVHGGQRSIAATLEALSGCGVRMAEAGEFTRRAFMNGKMDLSAAEAVMDLIAARSRGAHRVALEQLRGRLCTRIREIQNELKNVLAAIEVTVDYPEEDIEEQTGRECREKLTAIQRELAGLLSTARAGRTLREGVRCAIVGLPNAGKSSLLNALCGMDRAIVTQWAGTTRDTLEQEIDVDGLDVTLVDTAGIRDADGIERMGVERAWEALERAQAAILVVDGCTGFTDEDEAILQHAQGVPVIVALNKADLADDEGLKHRIAQAGYPVISLSALKGSGVEQLSKMLYDLCVGEENAEGVELSNARHIEAVRGAKQSIQQAVAALDAGFPPDTAATDIREGWRALGAVTGETADEEIIDLIFSKFCVGK